MQLAISVGDINGIGLELIFRNHEKISKLCTPIYCVNQNVLNQASKLLNLGIPKDFNTFETKGKPTIRPSLVKKSSGLYSYRSFIDAVNLTKKNKTKAMVTLPIHKKAWEKADIHYVGHTDALRDIFSQNAIMMLGCEELFVALYTEHMPLKSVPKQIKVKKLTQFFLDFHASVKTNDIAVLGLNPHAGDNGVLGVEEIKITKAIQKANKILNQITKGMRKDELHQYSRMMESFISKKHTQKDIAAALLKMVMETK